MIRNIICKRLKLSVINIFVFSYAVALNAQNLQKTFTFKNFDGSDAKLTLQISEVYYDTSIVDWTKYRTSYSSSTDQNYTQLISGLFKEHKPRLKFVFDAFQNALKGVSDEYLLKTMIRFIQSESSLPYKIPPEVYKGKRTSGILTPVAALVEGYGDCDTKSLLFACIASHKFDVIFLVGPTHAFIGSD